MYHHKNRPNRFFLIRFGWIVACILGGFLVLTLRLIQLQIFESEVLNDEGDRRSLRAEITLAKRGMIVDRMNKPLAISVSAFAIWADPAMISRDLNWSDARWSQLALILGLPLASIQQKIARDPALRFVYLSRQVTDVEAAKISELALPGIYQTREWRRFYPMGEKTAPLIGITDIDGNGIEGIEKSFDTLLSATSQRKMLRRGRTGNLLSDADLSSTESVSSIQLTIDERLQSIAYQALSRAVMDNHADSGALVLVDIPTGHILALANYPSI